MHPKDKPPNDKGVSQKENAQEKIIKLKEDPPKRKKDGAVKKEGQFRFIR
ncbi:MAG: hypothetical protein AB2693_28365 [Candidatus Thiodiazotropha sp.]